MGDKAKVNLRWLIGDYRQNSGLVRDDLNLKLNGKIDERILSVDFSELFAYSFYSKTMRKDHKLLDTIFTSKLGGDRDFKLVLAPPAIFELIEYYNSTRMLLSRFKNFEDVLKVSEANRFYSAYKKYQSVNYDKNSLDSKLEYKKLVNAYDGLKNYGNTKERDVGSLAFILKISSPYASESMINGPFRRLNELIENRTIIPLEMAVDDPGRISNLKTDRYISQFVFEKLQQERGGKSNNNLVDADLAGLCGGFNHEFEKDKIAMNVFSGSFTPNRIMYRHSNQIGMVIPRCPMYSLMRMFLFKKFKGNYEEMLDYAIPLSTTFDNMHNFNDIFSTIAQKINATDIFNIEEHNLHLKSLNAAYYSMRLLFYEYDLGDELIKASRDLNFDEILKDKLEMLIEDKFKDEKFFEIIDTQEDIDEAANANWDIKEKNEAYERAKEDLEHNLEKLYITLYDYVKAYDFNKLSVGMYDDYNYMIGKLIN
jgi:hypothetical protein